MQENTVEARVDANIANPLVEEVEKDTPMKEWLVD